MFSRVIFCTFLILPLLAAATAIPRTNPAPSCSTGTLSCCNSVEKVQPLLFTPPTSELTDIFRLRIPSSGSSQACLELSSAPSMSLSEVRQTPRQGACNRLIFSVIVTCSPITVIGVGGAACTEQTVCCTGNSFVCQTSQACITPIQHTFTEWPFGPWVLPRQYQPLMPRLLTKAEIHNSLAYLVVVCFSLISKLTGTF